MTCSRADVVQGKIPNDCGKCYLACVCAREKTWLWEFFMLCPPPARETFASSFEFHFIGSVFSDSGLDFHACALDTPRCAKQPLSPCGTRICIAAPPKRGFCCRWLTIRHTQISATDFLSGRGPLRPTAHKKGLCWQGNVTWRGGWGEGFA